MPNEMVLKPVGIVHAGDTGFAVEIYPEYRPALKELGGFSHIHVLWWGGQADNNECRKTLTCIPPYAKEHETGVFATRSPAPLAGKPRVGWAGLRRRGLRRAD